MWCVQLYSDMCSVVSVTMKNEYELVSDAVLGTDLHQYTTNYIRWFSVGVDIATVIVPPYTIVISCTVTTAPLTIVIIWSTKLHPIYWMRCKMIIAFSSKPSNSQWVFFTGTSYTELIVVEVRPGLVILLIIHSHLQFVLISFSVLVQPEVIIEVSIPRGPCML